MQPKSEQNLSAGKSQVPAPVQTGTKWPVVDRRNQAPEPGMVPRGVYTLRSLIDVLSRRRYPLAITFLLLFGTACVISLLIPKRYDAEAKLMLRRTRIDAPVTADRGALAGVPAAMTEGEVNAEVELLHSRDLMEEVSTACRLAAPKPSETRSETLARGVRELEKGLTILPLGKTNLISIQFRAADPALAASVVNHMVEAYLRKHTDVHRAGNAAGFFESQAAGSASELKAAERQLASFRSKDGVSSLPDEKASTLKRVADLEAALQDAESSLGEAANRARLLGEQRAALPTTIETGTRIATSVGLIERLKGQLVELQNKRTELLTKYEPSYRLVREVDQQIQDTRAALDREQHPAVVDRTDAPNPLRQSIDADLLRTEAAIAGLRARRESLAQDLASNRQRLRKLDALAGEHDNIQRRLKLAEDNYLLYQKKEEESRLEEALDRQRILNVSVVENAAAPADAAPRHRAVILMIGFLIACFGGVATAFLADYFSLPPAAQAGDASSRRATAVLVTSIPALSEPARAAEQEGAAGEQKGWQSARPVSNADRSAFVAAAIEKLTRHMPEANGQPAAETRADLHAAATAQPMSRAAKRAAAQARRDRISCMRDRTPDADGPLADA